MCSVGLSASDVALKLRSQKEFFNLKVKRAVIEQNVVIVGFVRVMNPRNLSQSLLMGSFEQEILVTYCAAGDWLNEGLKKPESAKTFQDTLIAEYDKKRNNVIYLLQTKPAFLVYIIYIRQ